jgi:hypothetical protein
MDRIQQSVSAICICNLYLQSVHLLLVKSLIQSTVLSNPALFFHFFGPRMNDHAANITFWVDWQQAALAAGVAAPLAELGCEVLRTHRKNRWGSEFLGVEDDGPQMLAMCLSEPAHAEMLFTENLYPYNAALLEATRVRLGVA